MKLSPDPLMHVRHEARQFPRPASALPALLLIALAIVLASCTATSNKPRTPRVPVTVATARDRAMPFDLISTGTVEPIQSAAVGSQVGGVITRVAFHEGDEVSDGEVLFELDPRPFRASLDQALGALQRDRSHAETARLDMERSQKLFEQGMISQSEWDQKRSTAETWAGTARADSAAAVTARLNLQYASIRAPFAGRTGRLMMHEGDYVKAASADPLVTINQIHPVRVSFTVPDNAVSLVQRYRNARPRVLLEPQGDDSTMIEGSLAFVDNAVDASSGTLLLKGEFANRDGRLVPGQFVGVRLRLYVQAHVTVVPAPAVTSGQQGAYVYVMNADSTVTPRPVVVDRTADELAIVSRGLQPGETVVTDGQLRLSPGAKVVVRKSSEAAS